MCAQGDASLHRVRRQPFAAVSSVIAWVLAVLLGLGGCAGTPERMGGSSLSDANAKASSPDRKGKEDHLHAGVPVWVPPSSETGVAVAIGAGCTADDEDSSGYESFPEGSQPENENWQPQFTLGISGSRSGFEKHGVHRNQSISLLVGASVPVSGHPLGGDLEFNYGEVGFSSDLAGFNRGREYTLGANLRYSLTPVHTALDVFLLVGARGGLTSWNYRMPMPIEDEFGVVRLVQSDWLSTASLYTGAGLTLIRSGGLQLGTSVRGGVQWWDPYTHAGLFNDLFSPVFFGQLRLDLSFIVR